jgi:integrase
MFDQIADAVAPRYRALVLGAAYTGLRWGELAGLRVPRVDFLRRRIDVAEVLTEGR